MRILVDEDSQAHAQVNMLRGDGHDVVSVGELGKNGIPDGEVFDLAQSLERVLLTHNAEDFRKLHEQRPGHRGVMAVYRGPEPRKNMTFGQICAAIRHLETSAVPIAGGFHVLNHWRQLDMSDGGGSERHCNVEGEAADTVLAAFHDDILVEIMGDEAPGTSDIDVVTASFTHPGIQQSRIEGQ